MCPQLPASLVYAGFFCAITMSWISKVSIIERVHNYLQELHSILFYPERQFHLYGS